MGVALLELKENTRISKIEKFFCAKYLNFYIQVLAVLKLVRRCQNVHSFIYLFIYLRIIIEDILLLLLLLVISVSKKNLFKLSFALAVL